MSVPALKARAARFRSGVPLLLLFGIAGCLARGGQPAPARAPMLQVRARDVPALAGKVFLTFDDGTDDQGNTTAVLDALKAAGVSATFCFNSKRNVSDRALRESVARVLREGHSLCNHSADHPDLTKLSARAIEAQFARMEASVRRVMPDSPAVTLVRTPFLAMNPTIATVVARHGVHIGVDFVSHDTDCWADAEPKRTECANTIRDTVVPRAHGIVLLHSLNGATATAVPDILAGLKARHAEFGTIEELVLAKYGKRSHDLYLR